MNKFKNKTDLVSYIDCHNIWRNAFFDGRTIKVLRASSTSCLKAEKNLLLTNLGEIELVRIKGLQYLIDSEFSRPFLKVAAFVKQGNEAMLSRDHLSLTGCHIIAEETTAHALFPLHARIKVQI